MSGTAMTRWNCQRWIQCWISGAVLRRDRGEAGKGGGGGMRLKGGAMLTLFLWSYADEESFVLVCDVSCWRSVVLGYNGWIDFLGSEGIDLILYLHFAIVQVFRVFNLLFTAFSCFVLLGIVRFAVHSINCSVHCLFFGSQPLF